MASLIHPLEWIPHFLRPTSTKQYEQSFLLNGTADGPCPVRTHIRPASYGLQDKPDTLVTKLTCSILSNFAQPRFLLAE